MPNILLVENSKLYAGILKTNIESKLNFKVTYAPSFSDAQKLINKNNSDFFIGLLDFSLPDAPNGEIVDYMLSKNLPSIVFTGEYNDDLRKKILSKQVIDYVFKEGFHNVSYVVSLIKRIHRNKSIGVLLVEDSVTYRMHISSLLKIHQYKVFEASNGEEALKTLEKNKDIKMVITDYTMPKMDGFQLIKEIRKTHSKEKLAIIGMSAVGNNILSAKFIKNGANDFISKPVLNEELYCRISQNMDIIEFIEELEDSSNKDYLTGMYNRRYFFDFGRKLYENAKRGHIELTVAMIDVDFFKKVNDTYGHDAGDIVLKEMSNILIKRFRQTDIVARFGGEEFCIMGTEMGLEKSLVIFEDLRKAIENTEIDIGEKKINITVSIGLTNNLANSLDDMIAGSDALLYKAKEGGRNVVMTVD